jgi:hypothetical protein
MGDFKKYEKLAKLANTIWDNGVYISTNTKGEEVINTYFVDGFIAEVEYCTRDGRIIGVQIDESLNFNVDFNTLFAKLYSTDN